MDFGNIVNKNIEFSDGINLIHGDNEAGKSTLVYFIKSMFYGVNRNKGKNPFSELERFKPWKDAEFSGKMDYVVGDEKFSAFRDFNRNNSKVFDESGNDITGDFSKDKSRGVELGFSHLGIDEETFLNSIFISQGNVIVEDNERKSMIQKLTNIIQSGDEAMSFDKAKQKLHKYLLDEVGTERTHNKPINVVTREIEAFEKTREGLIFKRTKKEDINEKKKDIAKRIEDLNREYEDAEKVFEVKERYARLVSEREKEYEISLKVLEKEKTEKTKKRKKTKNTLLYISSIVWIAIAICLMIYKLYIWSVIPLVLALASVLVISKFYSLDVNLNPPQDLDVIKENLKRKEKKELELLNKGGVKESLTSRKLMDVKNLINGIEKNKNDLLLEEHKLNIENENVSEHVERLNDVEEQLCELYEKEEDIRKLEYSIKLAEEKLDEAYEELKADIVPHIEGAIKSNIAATTNGKYVDTIYNDREGLLLENSLGDIVSVDKLSMGTIDQMYLGFRFALSEKIGNVPIFLDETFAYYDDIRLENILRVLAEKSRTSQIFIMTCSDRERRILDRIGLGYNEVRL